MTKRQRAWRPRLRGLERRRRGWLLPGVALYWRRPRPSPRTAAPPRAAAAAVVPLLPALTLVTLQNHLHLTRRLTQTTVSAQASPGAPAAVPAFATPEPRILHRITAARAGAARALNGARPAATPSSESPMPAGRGVEPRARRTPLAPPVAPHTRAATTVAPPAGSGAVAKAARVRASLRPPAEIPAPAPLAWPAPQTRGIVGRAGAVTGASRLQGTRRGTSAVPRELRRAAGPPAVQLHRSPAPTLERFGSPVPMQWRQASAAGPASARVAAGGIGPRSASTERTFAAAAEPAAAVVPAAVARVAPPPPALDRAAIDRLADDVMQRIERRIRIERERRGL